jgi:uncharacterized protein (DUF4415 family)
VKLSPRIRFAGITLGILLPNTAQPSETIDTDEYPNKQMKKSSGSSRRAKPRTKKFRNIKINSKKINREISALLRLPDEKIDLSNIPEVKNWTNAVVGKFYRPRKEPITIRLDADVLAWLKAGGSGYQTRINTVLRDAMKPSTARTTRRARKVASRG